MSAKDPPLTCEVRTPNQQQISWVRLADSQADSQAGPGVAAAWNLRSRLRAAPHSYPTPVRKPQASPKASPSVPLPLPQEPSHRPPQEPSHREEPHSQSSPTFRSAHPEAAAGV